jgi:soluble lytic murein transglycosylase
VLAGFFGADNMALGGGAATTHVVNATKGLILALSIGRGLTVLSSVALLTTLADAQTPSVSQTASATPPPGVGAYGAAPPIGEASTAVRYPQLASNGPLSDSDRDALSSALSAARRGDASGAQAAMSSIIDPVAHKIALWAIMDAEGDEEPFFVADQARRDLAGWPRASHRQAAAEKTIETSGLDPARIIAWFDGAEPQTPQGAMALAAAYEQSARRPEAQALIQRWWRAKAFEADVQKTMLARFGDLLTQDDHAKRLDTLLYGQQGPAAHDMLALAPSDQQALALARMALRENANGAEAYVERVPPSLANDPGLVVERARYFKARNLDSLSLGLIPQFPSQLPNDDAASRIWTLRRQLIVSALKAGDYRAAYAAATNHGLTGGVDYSEAEFYAGWIALSKLHDPAAADVHFANIQRVGASPITQSRALYWRGRSADARGDAAAAKDFYQRGARYLTTFYGQLAAEKAGMTALAIGHDPAPTAADQARFEGRELIRASRILAETGERDLFRTFVLSTSDDLPSCEEYALMVDLARGYGDQDLAMRVVRVAAQHGFILPDRGYPMRTVMLSPDAAEAPMVFGITRQESNFDPRVRSGVGARGMMQLMPETARAMARRMGQPYQSGLLDDPDYNMRLGSSYLGHLIGNFSGSYVLATAAYNAGPGRPAEWAGYCGDPRQSSVDPVDFIECIPFSETRNYVMRVMEAAEVYRARMNGGSAPILLSADLKRGGYVYGGGPLQPLPTSNDPIGALLADGQTATPAQTAAQTTPR